MPIRREDKEFIQALSLFGALLGACIGVFGVVHISTQARQQHSEQNEYEQTHAALLKLSSTVVNPSNPIADENVLNQVQQQIQQTPVPKIVSEKSFWARIPRWGYLGICSGGGVLGALSGYYGTWVTGWCGTIFICYLIRFFYRVVRRVAPDYAASIHLQPVSGQDTQGHIQVQREDGRMLPTLVKLSALLLFLLGVLAAVVWHLTAI
ncbi:MAG: hypothetical protein J7K65_01155 [Planctomycetes bacterium]|nr:hypothetical protein [Planctomycetota bacterium]